MAQVNKLGPVYGVRITWRLGMREKSLSREARGHPNMMAVAAIHASALCMVCPPPRIVLRSREHVSTSWGLGQMTSYWLRCLLSSLLRLAPQFFQYAPYHSSSSVWNEMTAR